MVFIGSGIGLTGAPDDRVDHGAVPAAKAGIGSAVNDATRILGGTLGVAVIGSIYASLYWSQLMAALPGDRPAAFGSAERSVGAALSAAARLDASGHPYLAGSLHDAAIGAFFHGFQTAVLVASGITVAGAIVAAILIPNQPSAQAVEDAVSPGPEAQPAASA